MGAILLIIIIIAILVYFNSRSHKRKKTLYKLDEELPFKKVVPYNTNNKEKTFLDLELLKPFYVRKKGQP